MELSWQMALTIQTGAVNNTNGPGQLSCVTNQPSCRTNAEYEGAELALQMILKLHTQGKRAAHCRPTKGPTRPAP